MKNYRNILFSAITFSMAFVSLAQAGILRVINKVPNQQVQLFIRGEGSDTHHVKLIEAGEQQDFIIKHEHVQGKNTFEVFASTAEGEGPSWELAGERCSNLVTDANHVVTIDSTLGKVSCMNVTAANPLVVGN